MKPLDLEDAATADVNLVPTKKFFKPVIVITCPLSRDAAKALECDYLFDKAGNVHTFEGSHQLSGELSGPDLTFVSQISGSVTIKTEKVVHFSMSRIEKVGLQLRFRSHIPEDKEDELIELLRFLAKLNKEKFTVTIIPRQGALVEVLTDGTAKDATDTTEHPFRIHIGKRPAIIGSVWVKKDGDEYLGGWEVKCIGLKGSPADGKPIAHDSRKFPTEAEAFRLAVECVLWYAREIDHDGSPKEIRAVGDLVDWCIGQVPDLNKAEKAKLQAVN